MIKKYKEQIMQVVFLLTACVSIAAVVLICVYLLGSGIPTIFEIGLSNFFGTVWKPSKNLFGILPMIVGSIYVTAGAIIIGVPIGLLCAIYLSRFCPKAIYRILKPAVELMAGIPSIVYGFFGLMVIVPVIQRLTGTSGKSLLTASILLGIMILPTIISVAESSLNAVPNSYYEGSLALGATHERSVILRGTSCGKVRRDVRRDPGRGQSHRRDHGSDYDCRQPGDYALGPAERTSYHDRQHRAGNGLCIRTPSGGADCHRRCAVCVYPHH